MKLMSSKKAREQMDKLLFKHLMYKKLTKEELKELNELLTHFSPGWQVLNNKNETDI